MIKLIKKSAVMLLVCAIITASLAVPTLFAAENALDYAGVGHTKYNNTSFVGDNLSMSGMGQDSGHVLFFQYDISGYTPDTVVNSAVWKAFCNAGTNWDKATIRIMTFDCEKSLGNFAVNHTELLAGGYKEDTNVLWSGIANSISAITFTQEIPNNETAAVNRYNINFTDAVAQAIKDGKKYFNFAIKPYTGYNELSFYTTKAPMPQLILDTVAPPSIVLEQRQPVEEGTAFEVSATVTQGDSAIGSVVLSVKNADGAEYTDFSGPVTTGDRYVWSFPSTMPSSSYEILAEVTDAAGLKGSDSINMRVLGIETFSDVTASAPTKTAVSYNGKWLDTAEKLEADGDTADILETNGDSVLAYFEYDLSENAVYNIKSAEWGCPSSAFSGAAELYAITGGWDEESIKSGNIPQLSAQPIAAAAGLDGLDVSGYITEALKKGASKISFALKTPGGAVTLKADEMLLTLEQSDNKRPEISAKTNKAFAAGGIVEVLVSDDDFITSVTATLDGAECTVAEGSDGKWNVTLPQTAESGMHKLTVSAKDYSNAEAVAEYALSIGTGFGEHSLSVSGTTAEAVVSGAEDGMILILAAYKNGTMQKLSVESDISGGSLSTAVDMSSEGADGVSFKSYLCTYSGGFRLIDVQGN